jgi:hypothetical protein
MRVTSVRVGAAKTINLGNYQSLRIEAAVEVDMTALDEIAEVRALAQTELERLMADTYKSQHRKAEAKVSIEDSF